MVEAGETIPQASVWFGLYKINMTGYQGHVIPVIIAVWFMCFLEKKLHEKVPEMIDLFVTPLVTVLVTGYLTLTIFGPIFSTLEEWILIAVQWIITIPFGIGAAVGSMLGIGATAYGVTGLFGFLTCADFIWQYAIMLAVSFAVSFVLSWIVHRDATDETGETAAEEPALPEITCEPGKVYAPIKGNVIPSADIPDETFAAGVLGEGVGIEPEEGVVYAPFDGEISSTTDTKHAIGISSPDGMELLIHVGVNTVAMEGDGFELFCAEGDQVKAGQKLMTFDIDKIKAAGYSTTTAVLVTNSDDYPGLEINEGGCDPLDCVITLSKEEPEEPTEV